MARDFPEWKQSMNFDNNNGKEEERWLMKYFLHPGVNENILSLKL